MKNAIILMTACLLLIAQPAYSIDLQSAKRQGLVGETTSGYLEAVSQANAETNALIDNINNKRKQKYQEIATRNKTSLQDVEILAGKKAIEKSASGSYIKLNGSWQKK